MDRFRAQVIRVLGLSLPLLGRANAALNCGLAGVSGKCTTGRLAGFKQLFLPECLVAGLADLTDFLKRSAARSAFQKSLCHRAFAHLAYLTDLF